MGVFSALCEGLITLKDVNMCSHGGFLTRRVANDIQDADGHITCDAFLKWWDAFLRFYPPKDETLKPKVTVPEPVLEDFDVAEKETSKADNELNVRRLSCMGRSATTWNEEWQKLCDSACDLDDPVTVAQNAQKYAEGLVGEGCAMAENILKRFLCPEYLKDKLQDGFYDKDGCFFAESGSLFVIPLHVLARGLWNVDVHAGERDRRVHGHQHHRGLRLHCHQELLQGVLAVGVLSAPHGSAQQPSL